MLSAFICGGCLHRDSASHYICIVADMRPRMQLVKAVLTPAGGLALVGVLGWTTADAVNEALVYRHCRRYFMQMSI
jgi:hypothetical protein